MNLPILAQAGKRIGVEALQPTGSKTVHPTRVNAGDQTSTRVALTVGTSAFQHVGEQPADGTITASLSTSEVSRNAGNRPRDISGER